MVWIINHTTDQVYKTIQERHHHLVLHMRDLTIENNQSKPAEKDYFIW